jgi:hypothetical protein
MFCRNSEAANSACSKTGPCLRNSRDFRLDECQLIHNRNHLLTIQIGVSFLLETVYIDSSFVPDGQDAYET